MVGAQEDLTAATASAAGRLGTSFRALLAIMFLCGLGLVAVLLTNRSSSQFSGNGTKLLLHKTSQSTRNAATPLGTLSASASIVTTKSQSPSVSASALPSVSAAVLPFFARTVHNSSVWSFFDAHVPLRIGPRWVPIHGVRSSNVTVFYPVDYELCPLAVGDFGYNYSNKTQPPLLYAEGFKRKCNGEPGHGGPCTGPMPRITAYDSMPRFTGSGERVQDTIQRALRAAWGPDPPHVDLYLRTGCGGTEELAYLLPTIELFWPQHIGEVIIVLDAGNQASLEHFLLSNNASQHSRQSYRYVFEDVPCLKGQHLNQASYVNADFHSSAQFITTIDSDCNFHSPVTPDLLFDERGRVLLPKARDFQKVMWENAVNYIMGPGSCVSHTMISQPVTFARETFGAYRTWIAARNHGECYYDTLTRLINVCFPTISHCWMCWMCEFGTYLEIEGDTRGLYTQINVEERGPRLYFRFSSHTSYEGPDGLSYEAKSRSIVHEGLCRALGPEVVPVCADKVSDQALAIVNHVTFCYINSLFFGADNWAGKSALLAAYIEHFRSAERGSRG